jgi:hypothetical protein
MKPFIECSLHEDDMQNPCSTWLAQGQGHQWCLKIWNIYSLSGSYLLNPLKEFHETLVKCSPHEDNVQNPCSKLASLRSRPPVVFEDLKHIFPFRFISSEPLKGISWNFSQMLSLWRWCAEPMFQHGQLKVKVTSGLNYVFCVWFISFEPLEWISWNFYQMFSPSRW